MEDKTETPALPDGAHLLTVAGVERRGWGGGMQAPARVPGSPGPVSGWRVMLIMRKIWTSSRNPDAHLFICWHGNLTAEFNI